MSLSNILIPNALTIYADRFVVGDSTSFISNYEELTIASTVTGIWATPLATTIKLCRVGALVTLYITMPAFAACNNASSITFNDNIPARFLPPGFSLSSICQVSNNGINSIGLFTCSSVGVMRVYCSLVSGTAINAGSNFTVSASGTGYYPISVSWVSPQN